jgi:nicotinate phosphoribosyltransferase
MVAYAGRPVLKLSTGKATWPDAKQIWRRANGDGQYQDYIGLADEPGPNGGQPLLVEAMRGGRRLHQTCLAEVRRRAQRELAELPAKYRVLQARSSPPVNFTTCLQHVHDAITADLTGHAPALTKLEGEL